MNRMIHLPVLLGTCFLSLARAATDDAVAVRVNGRIEITTAEVDALANAMEQSASHQGMTPGDTDKAELRKQVIDQLVLQRLLLDRADEAGITVGDDDVQAFIAEHLPPGVGLAQLAQAQGVTEEKLRSEVSRSMRINQLFERQFGDIPEPTDAELQAEFDDLAQRPGFLRLPEQVEARHILIRVEPDADDAARDAARTKIEGLRQRILDGGDFAALAAEHSACPSGARDGGNLGSFGRGQMVPAFDEASFTQEVGVLGEVVETNFGFHLIEVLSRDAAGERTLESEREPLTERIQRRKQGEIADAYLKQVREGAKVEVLEVVTPAVPGPADPE